MAEEHAGFANAVDAKGKTVDPRKIKAFKDESEAGKIRTASQTTPSSITQFHTDDQTTDGAPAARVVRKSASDSGADDAPDAKAAGGKGANAG